LRAGGQGDDLDKSQTPRGLDVMRADEARADQSSLDGAHLRSLLAVDFGFQILDLGSGISD
jgi:hypothetical protein